MQFERAQILPMSKSRLGLPVTAVLAAASVAAVPALLSAWGDAGHRITGEAAALRLPAEMPAFFRAATKQLAYLNPEPDRWRSRTESAIDRGLDGATAPDHFIDMEMAPPEVLANALRAPDRYGYLDTLRAAHIDGKVMGLLPFRALELSQRLREEFRLWRAASDSTRPWIEARIINDAGILGHYIADGSNPMHTSIYFNGWTGANPNGYATDKQTHARFESIYVDTHMTLADVLPSVDPTPRVFPDLRGAIVHYLGETNGELEQTYRIDKAHPFNAQTTAPENKAFVTKRLAAGARMLRDVWWTAWVTSAPAPPR
jgi:hypothetical protein